MGIAMVGYGWVGLNGSIFFVLPSERGREMINLRTIALYSAKLKAMILFTFIHKLIWFFKNYCAVF